MSGSEGEGENFEIDFAEFLNENSGMFTIVGVFAALAIYLSRITEASIFESELMIQIGFGAAFVIALVVMAEVYFLLRNELGSWHTLLHAHLRLKNLDLAIFTLCIAVIALTIYHILTRQAPVLFILILLAVVGVAMAIMIRVPYAIVEYTPDTPYWRVPIVLLFSGGTLTVSQYLYLELNSRFSPTTVQELTFNDPSGILLLMGLAFVGTVRSLASLGILAGFLAIPIIIVDKIRGVSAYDQTEEA